MLQVVDAFPLTQLDKSSVVSEWHTDWLCQQIWLESGFTHQLSCLHCCKCPLRWMSLGTTHMDSMTASNLLPEIDVPVSRWWG